MTKKWKPWVKHLSNAEIRAAFPGAPISPKRIGDAMKRKRDRAYWERKRNETSEK